MYVYCMYMYVCMYVCMYYVCVYVCVCMWMDGRMDGWMGGWMDGWMCVWVDGWKDGWMVFPVTLITQYEELYSPSVFEQVVRDDVGGSSDPADLGTGDQGHSGPLPPSQRAGSLLECSPQCDGTDSQHVSGKAFNTRYYG